jgi:hypothetical protein
MSLFAIKNSIGSIVDEIEAENADSALNIYRVKVELLPSDMVRIGYTAEPLKGPNNDSNTTRSY